MTDWAADLQFRNYGIRRRCDPRQMRDLLGFVLSLALVGVVLFGCLWMRSRILAMGYVEQRLRALEESLLRTQTGLSLEEETLKSPERIDFIARNQLGLTPPRPNQLLAPVYLDVESSRPTTLALANRPNSASGSR